mmetsp:Transcript_44258/g.120581  ORF Transcript_44258/g.120581 Transcript_44258/m.120581 type:complete len:259 (+) Transcript_44258:251-1027(+)
MRARSLIIAPRAAVVRAALPADRAAGAPRVIGFPGGGLYFFYQAGFVRGLNLLGYDLSRGQVQFTGASAGALSATLACANVDMERARDGALRLADAHRIKENPLGLRGVWGDLLRTWLDDLLPPDAHKLCDQRCHILVSSLSDQPGLPLFRRRVISHHRSREELLEACLASVHIPFFVKDQVSEQSAQWQRCRVPWVPWIRASHIKRSLSQYVTIFHIWLSATVCMTSPAPHQLRRVPGRDPSSRHVVCGRLFICRPM